MISRPTRDTTSLSLSRDHNHLRARADSGEHHLKPSDDCNVFESTQNKGSVQSRSTELSKSVFALLPL
jgi:hypothetical protein